MRVGCDTCKIPEKCETVFGSSKLISTWHFQNSKPNFFCLGTFQPSDRWWSFFCFAKFRVLKKETKDLHLTSAKETDIEAFHDLYHPNGFTFLTFVALEKKISVNDSTELTYCFVPATKELGFLLPLRLKKEVVKNCENIYTFSLLSWLRMLCW